MDLAAQFRQAASEVQVPDRRGRRYSATARRLAVRFCRQQRGRGRSFADIAETLGVHVATLGRWIEVDSDKAAEVADFHPVSVVAAQPTTTLTVTLPNGLRIDGLELRQVIELAQALS